MIFIPETLLKSKYGLDLRFNFACDSNNKFLINIAQKATDTKYSFSIFTDQKTFLYKCNFLQPPPWQLLNKSSLINPNKFIDQSSLLSMSINQNQENLSLLDTKSFSCLDQLVEELQKDPLAISQYVQNEIALDDRFLHQENGIFYASSIHRNPLITHLEKQGSAWEQCQLLIYLLRKAGYEAAYAFGECHLDKEFVEKMLFVNLSKDQKEAVLQYPWVIFFDGNQWISLFPWMKEIEMHEGQDLYANLPQKYSSANCWILHYLKGDEKILKHIGIDGDDTAGVLFVRFVEEELRKKGLSINDIGIHPIQLKKQFSNWQDFPHPTVKSLPQILNSLKPFEQLFAKATIEVSSRQNTQKKITYTTDLFNLGNSTSSITFSLDKNNHQLLHLQIADEQISTCLDLDESDQIIDIKTTYQAIIGTQEFTQNRTLSIRKGTTAALCFNFRGANSKLTSKLHEEFSSQKDENKKLISLLSFIGAAYFEKCSRAEKNLANLHKVNPSIVFSFGLSKFCSDTSKEFYKVDQDLILPQVDMFSFSTDCNLTLNPTSLQFKCLTISHSRLNHIFL